MIRVRYCKIALVASVALFATLVVFNNITDYGANFKFVQHVLMMDTIFPDGRQTWRAVESPLLHHTAYIAIILLQVMIAFLFWAGGCSTPQDGAPGCNRIRAGKGHGHRRAHARVLPLVSRFIGIGGEWYLMWQSEQWNAQQSAFRIAMLIGVVLLCLLLHDPE
jgi:predicted small integral membrane protein